MRNALRGFFHHFSIDQTTENAPQMAVQFRSLLKISFFFTLEYTYSSCISPINETWNGRMVKCIYCANDGMNGDEKVQNKFQLCLAMSRHKCGKNEGEENAS